ncbi:MAG: iron-containing alcohol dehydrogenase [Chloroflexi bacterium]|nr:iron-containing alcohol dehydrogenase [Chloroflexota bacterium]
MSHQNISSIEIPFTLTGAGCIKNLGDVVKDFKSINILIVTDQAFKQGPHFPKITSALEKTGVKYNTFDGCKSRVTSEVLMTAGQQINGNIPDLFIGIGDKGVLVTTKLLSIISSGTTTIKDLANSHRISDKAISKIMVPATSSGIEWSRTALFIDETNIFHLVRGHDVSADAVIIDPEITAEISQKITAETGFGALTHAIEAYTTLNPNIIADMLAENAIRIISLNIRPVYTNGINIEARYNMTISAAMGMEALTIQGLSLVHMMDEFASFKANVNPGATLGAILPRFMEINMQSYLFRYARIAELMSAKLDGLSLIDAAKQSIEYVKKLTQELGLKQKLSDLGLTSESISEINQSLHKFAAHKLPANKMEEISRILNLAL